MKTARRTLMLWSALLSVAGAQPADAPAEEAPPRARARAAAAAAAPPQVRIIWFGRTGGVSNHIGRNRAHTVLADAVGGALTALVPVGEGPRVFVRDGRILFRENGLSVKAFHDFLKAPPFRSEPVNGAVKVLVSPFEVVFEHPPAPDTPVLDLLTRPDAPLPGLEAAQGRLVRYANANDEGVLALELPGAGDAPIDTDPFAWEVRFVFEGRATPKDGEERRLFNVGRPLHDGPRRLPVLEALKAEDPDRTLVLAAGEDIEHYSFVQTGKPDLQRPNTWTYNRRLGLTALAPGAAEAAFGLDRLQREAQLAEVTVVGANLGGEVPFAGWRLVQAGRAQVLVVGVVNPDLPPSVRLRAFGDRAITPPGKAVNDAVAQATKQLGRRPDVVVALGVLGAAARQALMSSSDEVDVLLADFGERGVMPEDVLTSLEGADAEALRARDRYPLVVVPAGRARLGVLDLTLAPTVGAQGPLRIVASHSRAVPVTGDQPADAALMHAVQQVRQTAYGPAQVQLMADLGPGITADPVLRARFEQDPRVQSTLRLGGKPPARITADLWRQLVVNTLRKSFDAEVGLLPHLSFPWALTGPVTRLEAAANLNLPDEVHVVELTGEQMKALAKSAVLSEMTVTGIGADEDGPLVLGRPIVLRERYRVVTTDAVRVDPRLKDILPATAQTTFVHTRNGWEDARTGEPVKLRDAVLDTLEARALRLGPEGLLPLMHPVGNAKEPRWAIDFQKVEFVASRYSTFGPRDAYGEVRETRVTTQENTSIAGRGGVFLRRDAASVDWLTGVRADFALATYEDDAEQETADSVRALTELQVHAWAVGGGAPYVNVSYETEFTPTTRLETEPVLDPDGNPALDADGNAILREFEVDNPRKKRVEGGLGLVWSGEVVTSARIGAVVGHDFASEIADPEVGGLASVSLLVDLSPLTWSFDGELRYYLPGLGEDDPTELGTILQARTSLLAPVVGGLSMGVFVDLYGYRGQVDATSDPGASLITGVGLTFDRFLKPGYQ